MGDPLPGGTVTEVLSDIAVSPARIGTILGRDYVVCSFDTLALGAANGDIYVVGTTATWVPVATAAGVVLDFTSIALAPNWVGDRVVIGMGSDNIPAGNPELVGATAGDTFLIGINVATVVPSVAGPGAVRMDAAATDSPCEVLTGATDGEIVFSSITLPADFDSTSVGNFRAFVGWTSSIPVLGVILCADDAYRVDFNAVRKLEVRPSIPIFSVSYFGTVAGGTLMVASSLPAPAGGVWFSSDPQVAMPTWGFTFKAPTGLTNFNVKLTSETDAFAGGSGANSAFSYTTDGGLSFNGSAYIDEVIIAMSDVMPAPDGSSVFMATVDAAFNHSLWRCYGMPGAGKWDRVGFQPTALFTGLTSLIRISPLYLDDTTVYWFDAGAGAGTRIRRSTSDGQIWGTRTAPASPLVDATIENADILYVINGTNAWASTNGAWFFGLPTNAGIGVLVTVAMAASYPYEPVAGNVLVGAGLGAVALSTNGAASFIPLLAFAGTGGMHVLADMGYATNNIVYAGSLMANNEGIYKYEVGTSTAWENIRGIPAALAGPDGILGTADDILFPTARITGLAMQCGLLYGAVDNTNAAPSMVERALYPTAPAPLWTFQDMEIGSVARIFNALPTTLRACGDDTEAILFVIDSVGTGTLMAYIDTMAKQTATLSVPSEVAADPASSRNSAFTIGWNQISNSMMYDVDICLDSGCTQRAARLTGVPPNPAAPQLFIPPAAAFLPAGTEYYVRVRAINQVPGDAINSHWSDIVTFVITPGVPVVVSYLAPQPLGPAPGATGVPIANPGFTWSPYAETTKYEFKLASDAAMSDILAEAMVATTAFSYDGTLAYNTTFFWAVRGVEPIATEWSPVSSFTTEKKAVPPVVVKPAPPAPPAQAPIVTPAVLWAIIIIGAILVIAVIFLILRTRRVA